MGRSLPAMSENNEPLLEEPPVAGNEIDTLVGSLERQRRTLAWKCAGLNAAGLRTTAAASKISLGGLLKHLALVEDDVLSQKLLGREPAPRGTRWTGTPIPTGSGPRPPGTPPSNSWRSGRTLRPAPAPTSGRRWPRMASDTSRRSPTPAGSHPVSGVC